MTFVCENMNRYAFARSLQLLGLIIPILAISAELNDQVTLGESLMIAVIGGFVFYLGHSLQPRL